MQFGVTTVRDPGAITADAVLLRRLLREGAVDGPQLFTAGRILIATDFRPPGFAPVQDEASVRDEVRWQARAGVDAIKVYSSMPPDLVAVAIEEAHAHGLPVIGQLQRTTWTEAARMGIDVEHAAPWSAVYVREAERETSAAGMSVRFASACEPISFCCRGIRSSRSATRADRSGDPERHDRQAVVPLFC